MIPAKLYVGPRLGRAHESVEVRLVHHDESRIVGGALIRDLETWDETGEIGKLRTDGTFPRFPVFISTPQAASRENGGLAPVAPEPAPSHTKHGPPGQPPNSSNFVSEIYPEFSGLITSI